MGNAVSSSYVKHVIMSRNRLVSENEALSRAMDLFWAKGYGGTSLKDLEVVTGLLPGSLYRSFGSKEGLFLKVLDYYMISVVEARIAMASDIESPEESIRWFFRSAIEQLWQAGRTCMLTNAAIEVGLTNAAIAAKVSQGFDLIDRGLHRLTTRIGTLSDEEAHLLAQHLLTSYQGLLVLVRAQPDRKVLEALVEVALSALPHEQV